MKRTIPIIVISAILLSLCGFNVSASGMTVSAGNVSCDAGGSVSIPITLSGNTGFSNLGIEVEYDSSALTLKKVAAGSTGATYTAAQSITANPYNMGWDSTSNNTFNGTLATLEFEIAGNAAPGNYPITVSYYKGRNGNYEDGSDVNYDESFAPLNLSYVGGYVTVSGGAVSGKSIAVGDVQNDGNLSFEASLTSDESITGIVIAAIYDADSTLIAVKQYRAAAENRFSFSDIQNAATVKVFWWESVNGMSPQAHTKKITL